MAKNNRSKNAPQEDASSGGGGIDFGFLRGLIGFQLRFAAIAIFRDFKEAIAEYGITQHQHGVLQIVALNPASTLAQIAEALGTDRPTMVDIIKKLEERQLVRRQKSKLDGRRIELFLTEEGNDFLNQVNEKILQHEARITAGIKQEDLQSTIDVLRRIHNQAF